jgi:phenylalanyl-tRNA synthetase beta chain
VAQEYGIPDTMIAEMDFAALLPKHIVAKPISNYQGVYKDLSIVVPESLSFSEIRAALSHIDAPLLKQFYPVDIYQDEALGEQKSVTIRYFIQSMEGTMSDKMIDGVTQEVLQVLEQKCGAQIR